MYSQGEHLIGSNLCGATFFDVRGYKFQKVKHDRFPSLSYIYFRKNVGIEVFYSQFTLIYEHTYNLTDTSRKNVLMHRSRANIGLCFHYFVLKSKILYLSFFSGLGIKNSMDFTYLYTYISSPYWAESFYDTKDESFKLGLVYGANAKIFLHKRAYINLTLRQMNMIDNAKYQRNTLMTEIGVGARLGRLKKAK